MRLTSVDAAVKGMAVVQRDYSFPDFAGVLGSFDGRASGRFGLL
jgi:hypothetical protein